MISHKLNPNLVCVHPAYIGNKYHKRKFSNDLERNHPNTWKFIKHGLSLNPKRKEKKEDLWKVNIIKQNNFFDKQREILIWLGHSSFFICLNGINLLIDPIFFDLPFYPRKIENPCHPDEFKNIDYILISHNHRDHCDKKSLSILIKNNPEVVVLTGLNNRKSIPFRNKLKIQEAGWYQHFITNKKIEIVFTPAVHWSRRNPWDKNQTLWGGFYIKTANTSIFFAGDTKFDRHFEEIRDVLGTPKISLMPIGTYEPDYVMKSSHMDPMEAYSAFDIMDSSIFIPMHYGTYDLSNEPLGDPIRKTKNIFHKNNKSHKLTELSIGETWKI